MYRHLCQYLFNFIHRIGGLMQKFQNLTAGQRARNAVVGLDQTGNAIAGGNLDTTISGRIHWNCSQRDHDPFWDRMEGFVDKTFYELDGEYHCMLAYASDPGEEYHDANTVDRVFIVAFSVPVCLFIRTFINPYLRLKKRFTKSKLGTVEKEDDYELPY